ncbi:hypothetical protein QWY82_18465 [Simiduia curdlanivorans]|uniref:Lipoprotein n=1 Tax=Simiduia curdlanivorans TaxID=1492769 RepID=A0ABV8V6W9_9GAMM|nr:hypothetical protein [Simiduia curdlanivorans]MDN3640789.1 hypothetical protein [Simiduia curdlanivorans]
MKKTTLFVSSLILSACVKLEIKPEHVVSDSVEAGKDLYQLIKHKKDGTEERKYSHTLMLEENQSEQQAGQACLSYVEALATSASKKKISIKQQETKTLKTEQGLSLSCSLHATIKPR